MTDQQKVDDWNRDNATGRVVCVRRDDGGILKTVTRTGAILMKGDIEDAGGVREGEIALIYVEGVYGPLFLDRVTPYNGVGDIPDADRAGGGATCPDCGEELRKHPADLEHLGKGGIPFLTRLCSGRIVKL